MKDQYLVSRLCIEKILLVSINQYRHACKLVFLEKLSQFNARFFQSPFVCTVNYVDL